MEDISLDPYDTSTHPLTPKPHRSPKRSPKKEIGGGELSINSKNNGFRTELENIQEEDDGLDLIKTHRGPSLTKPTEEVTLWQSEIETLSSEPMGSLKSHEENYDWTSSTMFDDEDEVFEEVNSGRVKLEDLLDLESDGTDKTIENIRQVQRSPLSL
jgi:hypothetical protein